MPGTVQHSVLVTTTVTDCIDKKKQYCDSTGFIACIVSQCAGRLKRDLHSSHHDQTPKVVFISVMVVGSQPALKLLGPDRQHTHLDRPISTSLKTTRTVRCGTSNGRVGQ